MYVLSVDLDIIQLRMKYAQNVMEKACVQCNDVNIGRIKGCKYCEKNEDKTNINVQN